MDRFPTRGSSSIDDADIGPYPYEPKRGVSFRVALSIQSESNPDEPLVSADGQPAFEGSSAVFPIEVTVADETFPLLEEKNHSHFHVLAVS